MKLLAVLRATDVDDKPSGAVYTSFGIRKAGRVVLFDGFKVALLYISKHKYYMLQGGGLDGESLASGIAREIREELGCDIRLDRAVGRTELYLERWHHRQIDYCFTAYVVEGDFEPHQTNFEMEEGHRLVWAPSLREAIVLVENEHPTVQDGRLIRARDLIFLKRAQAMLPSR